MPSLLRSFKDIRYKLFYALFLSRRYPLLELGDPTTGCNWRFCPTALNASSIVYSGGVGRDVTFEHGLVEKFGCDVVLVDPSPTGLETMARPENQVTHFKFLPVALAGRCGKLALAPPYYPEEGSWFARPGASGAIEVEAVDLTTLMRMQQHDRIDLLKIDIEGAEYEVLDDLLARRLPVRQVAVEFHHSNLPGIRRSQSIRAILKMRSAGYKLIDVYGNNHTFLRPDP
jgi:FkbM family methyltransferase